MGYYLWLWLEAENGFEYLDLDYQPQHKESDR